MLTIIQQEKMMKKFFRLFFAATLLFSSGGMAIGAPTPTFDIDFYGGDTGLVQGVYDTNTNLSLSAGESVSVDILVSGFNDPGDGLAGWALRLEHGDGLSASNLERNTDLWTMAIRRPDIQDGYLTIEGLADFNVGIEGDDNILFSFDLTAADITTASVLTLWDFDKGGGMDDAQTLSGYTLDGAHLPVDLATINAGDPVPVPAAVWLFGSGLTGLLAIRRRKTGK